MTENPAAALMPTDSVASLRAYLDEDPRNRIFLAVDCRDMPQLVTIDRKVAAAIGAIKVGNELHNSVGWPGIVNHFQRRRARGYYYDARFSETPSQMRQQMEWFNGQKASVSVKGGLVSVDVLGASDRALQEAVEHRGSFMLVTETVQPSLTEADCLRRHKRSPVETVLDASQIAVETALHGLTASAFELEAVAENASLGGLVRIASGIRVAGDSAGDQVRVTTPGEARRMGAEILVVGHSILNAPDHDQYGRMMQIAEEIAAVA